MRHHFANSCLSAERVSSKWADSHVRAHRKEMGDAPDYGFCDQCDRAKCMCICEAHHGKKFSFPVLVGLVTAAGLATYCWGKALGAW